MMQCREILGEGSGKNETISYLGEELGWQDLLSDQGDHVNSMDFKRRCRFSSITMDLWANLSNGGNQWKVPS